MPDEQQLPVIVLFGPTASGKTEILERLFADSGENLLSCGQTGAEIVSADSMQVYQGMDIGTAKVTPEVRKHLPHHLIDICDPREQFDAAKFINLADKACIDIFSRGKIPVISGGTGFYLKNFIQGLSEAPPANPEIRKQLEIEREQFGIERLAEELKACDPISAARIHLHDEYRLLRALEVYRSSGEPLSNFAQSGSMKDRPSYRFLTIGLTCPREKLYERINLRCTKMFQDGLADEIRALHEAGYGPNDPGLKAIGYKEFFVQDENGNVQISKDLQEVERLIARNSRRYAKRQILYFSSIPDVVWIETEPGIDHMLEKINLLLREFLFQLKA
jgi:tRNA dimethylallyltransferase